MTDFMTLGKERAAAGLPPLFDNRNFPFVFLFTFRYLRSIVHLIAFCIYRPTPIPSQPTVRRSDVTVIIPTVEPENPDFIECLHLVLKNTPAAILVVAVGEEMRLKTDIIICPFRRAYPSTSIRVIANDEANKRQQVCRAIPMINTTVTVLVDDHVFWPSPDFLPAILAPFEDPKVGVVGTKKRVCRLPTGFGFRSFWNVIGALYLERHNFELRATNAIDGGVFVISGRTAAHRTTILQDPAFIEGFTNERFFFGKFGPLNADDDNFITRWEVSHGWKIKFQDSEDATIETTLGTYPKFLSQCLRWVRTTWRSNSASLFTDRTVWRAQPWCVYAVYISSFFNFALFYDSALLYTLIRSSLANVFNIKLLLAWILISKTVKYILFFLRHPADLIYLPGCWLFAYFHSFIKLYAGLTFWVTAWGGRDLAAINHQSNSPGDDDNADDDNSAGTVSLRDQRPDGFYLASPPDGLFLDGYDDRSRSTDAWSENVIHRHRRPIATPWGFVAPKNLHTTAANVLESRLPIDHGRLRQISGLSMRRTIRLGPPLPSNLNVDESYKFEENLHIVYPYSRNWKRGDACNRLHFEENALNDGYCK